MDLICNVVISIIVLYSIYIGLTIIKCNVLTCFDKSKITRAFQQKVVQCDYTVGALRPPRLEHCDFPIGALRLGLGHSEYNPHIE